MKIKDLKKIMCNLQQIEVCDNQHPMDAYHKGELGDLPKTCDEWDVLSITPYPYYDYDTNDYEVSIIIFVDIKSVVSSEYISEVER